MSNWPLSALRVAIRGGGDLGSGVAYRLRRSGFPVLITELPSPLLVRRMVSFGSAVLEGPVVIEGITARRVETLEAAFVSQNAGEIPVLVDPDASILAAYNPVILIDARMHKTDPGPQPVSAPLVVGLGPGFIAPDNCHAVIETNRGHYLGRVIRQGTAQTDTGMPEGVLGETNRVLRAPVDGTITGLLPVGMRVEAGHPVARVGDYIVNAPFTGVLRGLVHNGLQVSEGLKIGDLDPRGDPAYAVSISDKALAVSGGVLEAILSSEPVREWLGRSP